MNERNSGEYRAALYMRLSKDDEGQRESASISTQRIMLRAYAEEHGFAVQDEFIDDGYSGTSFDRPAWKRLILDIEAGRVNMVITKDLSRLGRDYIGTGQYTELYFPSKGIRYIAINDGYDSDSSFSDIVPFKNVFNEMYARDTSRKIKSAFQTKISQGEFIGNFAPYGYRKDPEDKNHLLVDQEAAMVVRQIFTLAGQNSGPGRIADCLNSQGILPPSLYRRYRTGHLSVDSCGSTGKWSSSMVCKLLSNIVYTGTTAQGKSSKVSFKSSKIIRNPRKAWVVVEGTHEPIVSRELFESVTMLRESRRHEPKSETINLFSGIARCADCGCAMSLTGSRRKDSPYNLTCQSYKLHGSSGCTNHFVDYQLLMDAVIQDIGMLISEAGIQAGESIAADRMAGSCGQRLHEETEEVKKEKLTDRNRVLLCIIKQLYEDRAAGRLEEEQFYQLLRMYEEEQHKGNIAAVSKAEELQLQLQPQPEAEQLWPADRTNRQEPAPLTPSQNKSLISCFIDIIEIGQGTYETGERGREKRQEIRIYYKCYGSGQR